MMSTKRILMAVAMTSIALLQGCASVLNPVGDSQFDCNRKQDPKSPYCRSFKAVEAATTADLPKSRFDQEFKLSDNDRMTGIAPDDKPALPQTTISQSTGKSILPHQGGYDKSLAGLPVREGPIIQKIWIKRFVDDRDLLTENVVVLKEIRGTRWAGFDAASASQNGRSGAYPHNPPATTVTPAPAPAQSRDSEKTQETTDFKQPGYFTRQDETVITPTASGVLTMPQ